MEKKYDVIALGELLIDFTMNGQSEQGNNMFEACPGGAPCNVLALLNKMGKKTAFIGKVGKDQFGTLLRDTITEAGIDASQLATDDQVNTTLAFEYSTVDADIRGKIDSVLNPSGGTIRAEHIGDLIIEKDKIDPSKTKIICSDVDHEKQCACA